MAAVARQSTVGQRRLRCIDWLSDPLAAIGVRGERVALIIGNSIEMATAMFAVHAAGAQAVPVNPAYTPRELDLIIGDAAPRLAIVDAVTSGAVAPVLERYGVRSLLV